MSFPAASAAVWAASKACERARVGIRWVIKGGAGWVVGWDYLTGAFLLGWAGGASGLGAEGDGSLVNSPVR